MLSGWKDANCEEKYNFALLKIPLLFQALQPVRHLLKNVTEISSLNF